MSNRISIGIDLDTTLNTLNVDWLDLYNKDYNDNLAPKDLLTWDMTKYVKPECNKKIFDYLFQPYFFRSLGIQPNAYEVTKYLQDTYNFDLYIVTAYSYQTCYDKAEWVKEHLPHIPVENIIFCNDKSKINMHYLIDDRDLNIETFKGIGIVFDQPYNRHLKDYIRCNGWLEIKQLYDNIYKDCKKAIK